MADTSLRDFIISLPKAELHLHLEGSLEADMMIALAQKNGVTINFETADDIRAAYQYGSLQDFLDLYYQGMSVLQDAEDFSKLTQAYLQRAAEDGVVHAEVFFDPQGHTGRGLSFNTVAEGIIAGLADGSRQTGISTALIMCFFRDQSEEAAFKTLDEAKPYIDAGQIVGVGLDSSEIGNPPAKFERVYAAAREQGLHTVAHAGEEAPAAAVRETIDVLKVERVDHGISAIEDPLLVTDLAVREIPLTVCPLSNVLLQAVPDIQSHPIRRLFDGGVKVTINSDDPAYFSGYIADNYLACVEAHGFTQQELKMIAANSISASFLPDDRKDKLLAEIKGIQEID